MDFQWQCPVCQKVITNSKSVTRHKKIHKETDYRCNKCSKEFTRPGSFKETFGYMFNQGDRVQM